MKHIFPKFQILFAVLLFLTAQLSYSQGNATIMGERPSIVLSATGSDAMNANQLRSTESATLLFYEGFEADTTLPDGWTQEVVNGPLWYIGNGNPPFIPNAAAGSHNVVFLSDIEYAEGLVTRLVTPPLDMTGTDTAVLQFSYTNPWRFIFSGIFQDVLKIKYKSALADDWTTLETFHTNVMDWTEVNIVLPNLSDSYYIAFEGESYWGYGIGIDEIMVNEGVKITAGAEGNGIIYASGEVYVPIGSSPKFTITPYYHYHISALLVDDVPIAEAVGKIEYTYTFASVNTAHTIMAYFAWSEALSVTVEVVPTESGLVRIEGDPYYGNTIELWADIVGDEYYFSHWSSNGDSISAESPFVFVLQSDTVIQAHFSLVTAIGNNPIERIQLYPNPAHDHLNIKLPAKAFVQVFDQQGRLQYEANLPAGEKRLNLSESDQGMYVIRLQFEDQVVTKKILRY